MSSTADRYEISSRLAVGDAGFIYKATDRSNGNTVALKLLLPADQALHPLDVAALLRDAPAISHITGANIVQLLDAFQDEDGTVLVYEFAEGLRGLDVPVTRPILATQAAEMAAQLLAALSCGELMQYPHGGLKPSDISLATLPDGRPLLKVLDWGLANYRSEPTPAALPYTAPECLAGAPPSHGADLFAAGAVLYYLFTGQQPVNGSNKESLAMAWRMLNPLVLHHLRPDLPSALIDWMARLLQPDPSQRPASAADALTALAAVDLSPPPPPSVPETVAPQQRPRTQLQPQPRRRMVVQQPVRIQKKGGSAAVFVTSFLLLLTLGAGGYFYWQITQTDETPELASAPTPSAPSIPPPSQAQATPRTTQQAPTIAALPSAPAAAPEPMIAREAAPVAKSPEPPAPPTPPAPAAGQALATFSASAQPPTVDQADIANLTAQTGTDKWFFQSNAELGVADAAKGTTFTTGDAPVSFKALTYKIADGCKKGATPEHPTSWTVRLGTLAGKNFTQIASAQAEQTADTGAGDYLTWKFANPVSLAANTTYAVDVTMLSGTDWKTGIPYLACSGNVTTQGVGHYYNSGDRGVGGPAIAPSGSIDRIFHVDLQAP